MTPARFLKVGGSTWNTGGMAANASAYIIDNDAGCGDGHQARTWPTRAVTTTASCCPTARIVIGGQTAMEEFSDAYAVLALELFDPATNTFTVMPSMSVARNYHSIAMLLPDGRVLSGGGGLCACGRPPGRADSVAAVSVQCGRFGGTPTHDHPRRRRRRVRHDGHGDDQRGGQCVLARAPQCDDARRQQRSAPCGALPSAQLTRRTTRCPFRPTRRAAAGQVDAVRDEQLRHAVDGVHGDGRQRYGPAIVNPGSLKGDAARH